MNTKFGEWLFQWRLAQGLSVRAFGSTMGVSGAYISAIETGRNVVSKSFLEMLFAKYPEVATAEVLSYFEQDVKAHKKLKKSRVELIVWTRALASLDDEQQAESIRKALKQNGIDVPKQIKKKQ